MSFSEDQKTAKKFINKTAETIVRLFPLGGSTAITLSLIRNQDWLMVGLMFPIMVVTVAWAAFSEGFLLTIQENATELGKNSGNAFTTWIKAIYLTIRWRFAGADEQYLKCQGYRCQDYETEGFKGGLNISTPLLNEVFVPLDLGQSFIRNTTWKVKEKMRK